MSAGSQTPRFIRSFGDGLKRDWQRNILFVVLVMALGATFTAITGIAKTNEQNQLLKQQVACQNRYNEVNNVRTRLLGAATEREGKAAGAVDEAFLNLTNAMVEKDGRDPEVIALLGELRNKLEAQKAARLITIEERENNPVPPPPQALCGK